MATTPQEEDIPLDTLARIYRKIRGQISELTQEYDTKVAGLKEQQDEIKNAIKDRMKSMGVSSVRTTHGTIVLSIKTRYNTQDWDSFKQFVIEHQVVDLLERRIAQSNMAQFLAENPGLVPPGLNAFSEYDVSVRKPNS